jgi:competence protein ComEA
MLKTPFRIRPVAWLVALAVVALLPTIAWGGPVNLNTADADTIATELDGIGNARARAIVEYRDQYGSFESPEDLMNVSGIGRYIIDANKENILLDMDR